uniref:Uncharacterized protein n=1 Tax=Anopheles christyi TaxID=43041 RepID=A0A182KBA3_9DIPT
MVFTGTAEATTDAEFRSGKYAIGHQKRPTPLLDTKRMDIIKCISLADELHLLHIGLMKKLIKVYAEGSLTPFTKWKSADSKEVSNILVKIKLPQEIHRAMRPLKYLAYWKGSEFPKILKLNGITRKLFLNKLKQINGKSHVTSTVHNLLHIAEDVREFGPLPTISSYPFKGRLNFLKRLTELNELEVSGSKEKIAYPIIKNKKDEVIFYVSDKFLLRKDDRNGWFLTKDNKLIRYSSVRKVLGSFIIEWHHLVETQPAFSYPNRSKLFIIL